MPVEPLLVLEHDTASMTPLRAYWSIENFVRLDGNADIDWVGRWETLGLVQYIHTYVRTDLQSM